MDIKSIRSRLLMGFFAEYSICLMAFIPLDQT